MYSDVHTMIHTDGRPYKCDNSEAALKLKCDLNVHNRIHTGKKRYENDLFKWHLVDVDIV